MITLSKNNKIWTKNDARKEQARGSEIETYEFLYALVRAIKPTNILEMGTFEGDSAIAMGKGLKINNYGHLWTIDKKDYGQIENIEKESLEDKITCLIGDISTEIKKISISNFDLIFIDDGHLYSDVIRDLNLANKLTKIESYILVHDSIDIPEVVKGINDFLKQNNNFEKITLNTYFGILMLKKYE